MTRCRSCDAPTMWARTTAGKAILVDADPDSDWDQPLLDPGGTLRPTGRQVPSTGRHGTVPEVKVVAAGVAELEEGDRPRRWRPHFATCPDAKEWRRGR